jgi:hypothetical protein
MYTQTRFSPVSAVIGKRERIEKATETAFA